MSPIIMMAIAFLLIILALIRQIDWRRKAINWVGNNPKHCIIFVKTGNTLMSAVFGKRDEENPSIYYYRRGKIKRVPIVLPANYPEEYYEGRRLIGVMDGIIVASPLGFMTKDELIEWRKQEKIIDMQLLAEGNAVVKALKSISQKKPINWALILIIGAVLFLGYYVVQNYVLAKPVNNPVPQSTTPLPAPDNNHVITTVVP